jgi:hypothetical protein
MSATWRTLRSTEDGIAGRIFKVTAKTEITAVDGAAAAKTRKGERLRGGRRWPE